ncbi:MAG: DUF3160 domain-containing protein [Deltaproteobacteria bacterium]|nr:DUF3160 domain-containing protein [Deltaproteobacteria bacterium]
MRALVTCLCLCACSAPRPSDPVAARAPTPASAPAPAKIPTPEVAVVGEPWPERAAALEDACATSAAHLDAAIDAVLATAPRPDDAVPASSPAFDVTAARAAFALGDDAAERLETTGFTVLEATRFPTYADAYSALYAADRPLWVSVDAIFHAIWIGHTRLVQHLEQAALAPALVQLLDDLRAALADDPGVASDIASELDVYLGVGASLLADQPLDGLDDAASARIAELFERVSGGEGLHAITLLDVREIVDLGLFAPRGRYRDTALLERWFRAAMWLTRWPLDLAPDSPRATTAALRLAELADLPAVRGRLDRLELGWSLIAGEREDTSPRELLTMARSLGVTAAAPDAAARLHGFLAGWEPRAIRMHATWRPLVPFVSLLGPRSAPDVRATTRLLDPVVPGRHALGGLEVAALLGHDRALDHLAEALAASPALGPALAHGRAELAALADDDSAHASWLDAIRALSAPLPGDAIAPRFVKSLAFADHRIDSAVAAYAQLRHTHALFVPEPMVANGCSLPDAYVDPAPAVYAALALHARRLTALLEALAPGDPGLAWLARVERITGALERIARHELTGRPLTDPMRRFLAMIVEVKPRHQGYLGPLFEGWYIALHPSPDELPLIDARDSRIEHERGAGGLGPYDPVRLVTSIATSVDPSVVSYLGVDRPALGVFALDVGGPPRVVVGPVAMSFEARVSNDGPRYDDAAVPALVERAGAAPWRASYVSRAAMPPADALMLEWFGPGVAIDEGAW